jgi:hypothetical protein
VKVERGSRCNFAAAIVEATVVVEVKVSVLEVFPFSQSHFFPCLRLSAIFFPCLRESSRACRRDSTNADGDEIGIKDQRSSEGSCMNQAPMANEIQAILYLRLSNPKDFRPCVLTLVCVRPSVLHCNFSVILSACTNSNPSAEQMQTHDGSGMTR